MIGMDVEILLLNAKNQPVLAEKYIHGTKEEPMKIPFGTVQEDCTAAEVGIDPVTSLEDFHKHTVGVMQGLDEIIAKHKLKMSGLSSILFDPKKLTTPLSTAFGCTPDYDAYRDGAQNKVVGNTLAGNLRVYGGHLHFTDDEITDANNFVKFCDLYLGVPSVLMDNDITRRKLYGKAGSYRTKEYPNYDIGIEYRVLSNFWIYRNKYREWAFNGMHRAATMAKSMQADDLNVNNRIQHCINTYDKDEATALVTEFNVEVA